MKWIVLVCLLFTGFIKSATREDIKELKFSQIFTDTLAQDVKNETLKTWQAYARYAWPHDNLLPISKKFKDWYACSINMAPIDAYSTLKLMGFNEEASRIEKFVADSLDLQKDIYVKVFEVNIRILGGLLNIYESTGNKKVLLKAISLGDRLLKAFNSPTSIPYYYVNLKTGTVKGKIVNVAEAGSYLLEFGILSYYTKNPKYYLAAKKSTQKVFSLRSKINLLGRDIDVETGKWTMTESMVGAYTDSYFEYLYKSWLLFHDPEIKKIWNIQIKAIQKYIAEPLSQPQGNLLWYGKVDRITGKKLNGEVTLWDAYFPALLCLSGDMPRAITSQNAWDYVWTKNGIIPEVYDYKKDSILDPSYQLNPEVIESAYYLWKFTGDSLYYNRVKKYYFDIKKYCKTELAYSHLLNVVTKEKKDEMETFFIAETLKYFYLTFNSASPVNPQNYVFTTEAHPFRKNHFLKEEMKNRLGIKD